MSKFKVGDKIRVVKQHPSWEDNWVGTEGIITEIHSWNTITIETTQLPPGIKTDKNTGTLGFNIDLIALVKPKKPKKAKPKRVKTRLEDLIL